MLRVGLVSRFASLLASLSAALLPSDAARVPGQAAQSGPRAYPPFQPGPVKSPELDPQRERYRLAVEPYRVLGSGKPGNGPEDIVDPDGLAFDRRGRLLATDAQNRRIQIWDVKTGTQAARVGSAKTLPEGELVDLAVAPDGTVLVTDEKLGRGYAFAPKDKAALDPTEYTLLPGDPLGGDAYKKLGGIAIDAESNIYTVDAELNEVRKYRSTGQRDPAWHFPIQRTASEPFLKNAEGIALDEARQTLYIASEFDYVIHLFDLKTGHFLGKTIGARLDPKDHTISGKRVFTGSWAIFSGSPEGLSLMRDYLFAVDEFAGHVHVFDITNPAVFNRDLDDLAELDRAGRGRSGYVGFFGHTPIISLENQAYKKLIRKHELNPAEYNSPGYLCSPDSVATYYDEKEGEGYIAVADQCNYRIVVYRWSQVTQAAGLTRR